ncbi:related to Biotin--protein ligase [Saccharomycodes ludwigii]|uniref:Related to Biotin--protein ligase n=1 Tax=Saccharomycodes ludwigii TaxID=36035 RepID=A0A376B3N3_9ASCO|nr:hypothetical protein SCDLUD_000269 [Saccharomycodes ludwigii]KAH3902685.1 hypothetical protein SCDLUD_000269 [Saccharomycodes ludwigii]SSD59261.1 related to Biotin--protein ligase [Saccharomycodes ludwigii]
MNVLVYNGPGSSPDSVRHTIETLRKFLEPYYAVSTVSIKGLKTEPWTTKTSALVFPGGADLPYVKECQPIINDIKSFVSKKGGVYIGFCAGGYFGSSFCEFYKGHPTMEVSGSRELQFFPGNCRGPAYSGFQYNSEKGARVVNLKADNGLLVPCYHNGGGSFIDAENFDDKVQILAKYTEPLHIEKGEKENTIDSAVVLAKFGRGKALLVGTHPEYVPELLKKSNDDQYNASIVETLKNGNDLREKFMVYILKQAGLSVNEPDKTQKFKISPIFVSVKPDRKFLINNFQNNIKNAITINDDNSVTFTSNVETFRIYQGFENSIKVSKKEDGYVDPLEVVKNIILPESNESIVPLNYTPNFDAELYFTFLNTQQNLGSMLLYADVVTSTSTTLDSNKTLLNALPNNSVVFVGTTQISGRGRGGNSWVSPPGLLASTVVTTFPLISPTTGKPVSIVFVQYLAALAWCKAINSYADGYEDIPIKIKWPNDLYILNPEYCHKKNIKITNLNNDKVIPLTDLEPAYVKSAGILINTSFIDNAYKLLIGCGVNLTNNAPSVSIQMLINMINEERARDNRELLEPVRHEKLLALYINILNSIINQFLDVGVSNILPEYYKFWLHSNQIVTLTEHKNVRAKIVGITEDYGLLIAKELSVGSDNTYTGVTYNLQPDGNSFEIFKGLISKKVYN